MSRSRQLAAIMFTDIKGYTALMQQNEEKALQARAKHRRIFNASTEKHRGKVLQYYGDGTLSIFNSVIDAVHCSIEMQRGFREEPVLPVRIGIHSGDIVFSEEEIIGDSVNIASRIESLAVPGSVFISEKVYDEVKNQKSIKAKRLKAFQLKNIEKPVVVYAVANEGLMVPLAEAIEGKTEPPPDAAFESQAQSGPGLSQAGIPILATKLFVPPPRPGMVPRPRLADRLNQGLHGKLALISAPAGFGKSTLASEWVAACGLPAAWLSLDEGESEPHRFLAYLIAALQTIDEHIGRGVQALLQSPQPPPPETILASLLNEIAALPDKVILVLDDYHLVDSRAVDQALAFLLDHLPPQLFLVMTTREDPSLPLARLRVRGQLAELRAADLRFTPSEAAAFLRQAMGLDLSPEDIAALESRTEGWAAGLQMAALSMQGRNDTSAFIREFTGSHRFILDYLAEEVLQRQPDHLRQFLLQASILERMCGSLCDALTKRDDGRAMLEALERNNLFVTPLDEQRRWYRYHHLFADVLRAKAGEELAEELPLLHRRASEWYDKQHSPAEAIRHALAGGDAERAAGLIERAWPAMDEAFQTRAWLKWAEALPDGLADNRPVLLAAQAWALLNNGEMEAGEALLQKAEKWLGDAREGRVVVDQEQFRYLPASVATARSYVAQSLGDIPGSVKYAQQALAQLPEGDYLRRGPAASLLGLAYAANGELEAAYRALAQAMADFQKAGTTMFAISGTFFLADIRITQGRLREARQVYEWPLQLVAEQGQPPIKGTADLYLGLSELELEHGGLQAATQNLLKSEELGEEAGLPDWPCRRYVAKARLKEAEGSLDDALQLLQKAERLYYRTPIPETRPIKAQIARVWIKQGRLAEARAWLNEYGLSPEDDLSYLQEYAHITLARLLIAEYRREGSGGSIQNVLSLLERLLKAAEEGERKGSAIEILALQALAHKAQGNSKPALAALKQALTLAAPEGYARIFTEEGEPMARLLTEASAQGFSKTFATRLLAAMKQKSLPPSEQPLIEPLSERELEILQLIAEGLSNQEISERLFLALSTVKGHNRNIFGKLEVQRRTEAVARARELGLI